MSPNQPLISSDHDDDDDVYDDEDDGDDVGDYYGVDDDYHLSF